MPPIPNVLFILTDQQHFGMMSCAGNPHVRTPAMDRLAAEGVRFDRAYCANPVSSPSRFSLMTGRFPSEIGMFSNYLSPAAAVPDRIRRNGLGHLMRRAGYHAVYGGKVHLPRMTAADAGFDYFCRDEREGLAEACAGFLSEPRPGPFFLVASFINPHDICYMAIRDFAATEQERRLIANGVSECAALDQALRRPNGVSDEEFFARHCPTLPDNVQPQEDEPEAIRSMLDARPFRRQAREQWSDRRWREHRWAYARLTERVDAQIGQVLDALAAGPHADDTLIVFTSDHGDLDSAHRMEHKSALYDEAARVPLIVRPPGGTVGRLDRTHLVSNGLDLVPSFCDWAGVAPPEDLAGRSIRCLVEGDHPGRWRDWLPIESAVGRALITDRFKYARYSPGGSSEQLIDLVADPGETRNAAHDPEHRATLDRLRARFESAFAVAPGESPETPAVLRDA